MEQTHKKGISLRAILALMIISTLIIAGLMLFSTFHLSGSFRRLTETSEQQIEMRDAALELMNASDYLTEKVQRFTVNGDVTFLEEYFTEAFESNHREEAVDRMSKEIEGSEALAKLQGALDESVNLMNREYYAMRLVIEAKRISGYPEVLDSVSLSAEDAQLSSDEKMQLAIETVHDNDYYELKDRIRADMRASLNELERMSDESNANALKSLRNEMTIVRVVIAVLTVWIIFLVWLTSHLGIRPILNAVNRIKSDSPIPEIGANEFRYLAHAYNKMYDVYQRSLEHLNFKASHDELTGAYNRSGYELLLSSIDLKTTYILLFDVDNFKQVNDTYGHEMGDKVLRRLVKVLKSKFRSDDYICRIGGDEFVVFMVHATPEQKDLLATKTEAICTELLAPVGELPPISTSIGIVHGTEGETTAELFEKADAAMYKAKAKGKNTFMFYSDLN